MSIPEKKTSEGGLPMIDPLETLPLSAQYIVTPYHWPDTDGVSSALGVADYLLKAKSIVVQPMISQTPQKETQWVMNRLGISLPQIDELPDTAKVIIVDASDPDDLPSAINPNAVVAIIDHRTYHRTEAFPQAAIQIEPIGAAATLIAEKFHHKSIIPDMNTAILLYAGIASNTINFNASSTTERDRKMAQWIRDIGVKRYNLDETYLDQFVQAMFEAKSDFQAEPMKKAIGDDLSSRLQIIAGIPTAVGQLEIIGVQDLFRERGEEILEALNQIQAERGAGRIFLSAIDVNEGRNFFLFPEEDSPKLIANVTNISHNGEFYMSDKVITRKELIAALQRQETNLSMDNDVEGLVQKIVDLKLQQQTLLVAIDGRAGSGKSSLAKNLQQKLENVTIVHLDDFGYPVDRERLLKEVIVPLKENKPTKYQRYDWETNQLAEWIEIEPNGIVVLEGVRALDDELHQQYDYTIWIECPADIGFQRGLIRDKIEYGIDSADDWINVWMPHEVDYIASQEPQKRANIIFDGMKPNSL